MSRSIYSFTLKGIYGCNAQGIDQESEEELSDRKKKAEKQSAESTLKLSGFELGHHLSPNLGKKEADRERQRNTGMAGVENNVLCCIDHRPVGNRRTCGCGCLRRKNWGSSGHPVTRSWWDRLQHQGCRAVSIRWCTLPVLRPTSSICRSLLVSTR